jgi:hypothetical protein
MGRKFSGRKWKFNTRRFSRCFSLFFKSRTFEFCGDTDKSLSQPPNVLSPLFPYLPLSRKKRAALKSELFLHRIKVSSFYVKDPFSIQFPNQFTLALEESGEWASLLPRVPLTSCKQFLSGIDGQAVVQKPVPSYLIPRNVCDFGRKSQSSWQAEILQKEI